MKESSKLKKDLDISSKAAYQEKISGTGLWPVGEFCWFSEATTGWKPVLLIFNFLFFDKDFACIPLI